MRFINKRNSARPKRPVAMSMATTPKATEIATRSFFRRTLTIAATEVRVQHPPTSNNTRTLLPSRSKRRWCRCPRSVA